MNLLVTIYIGLLLGLAVNQIDAANVFCNGKQTSLNVAVIGAGVSGLCSAKHCLDEGHEVTVYEQSEEIGGVWYYTDEIGKDKYGNPIHSPMYQGLRTNGPFQVMSFPNFTYPTNTTSYPPQTDVLNYLHSYANHFELRKVIKLSRLVVRVLPIENDKWEVIVKNLQKNTFETKIYDVVFVCNGHNSKPFIPNIDGADDFNGKMIHSHDYRKPEPFHRFSILSGTPYGFFQGPPYGFWPSPPSKIGCVNTYALKDDVTRFTLTGAEFIDGSHETFDVVFFATGYNKSFPFLSVDSGVYIEKKLVQPLYKRIFNVEHPTMAFIGVSSILPSIPIIDFQVQFVLKFLCGAKKLPTKSEMLKDVRTQKTTKKSIEIWKEYVKQLSELAGIEPVSDVLMKIVQEDIAAIARGQNDFRKYRYIIIDDKTFRREKYIT